MDHLDRTMARKEAIVNINCLLDSYPVTATWTIKVWWDETTMTIVIRATAYNGLLTIRSGITDQIINNEEALSAFVKGVVLGLASSQKDI